MTTRNALSILWAMIGAVLIYFGAQDTLRWNADAEAIRMGFDWTDSYLPHGGVALLVAIGLMAKHRVGSWISFGAAIVFGLYYLAYLILGGEGAFHLRVIIPALLLLLVTATLRFIRRASTNTAPRSTTASA